MLTGTAFVNAFSRLWRELPPLHGCICAPIPDHPDLWSVCITGKTDVGVAGLPLLECLEATLRKWEESPTEPHYTQAEYTALVRRTQASKPGLTNPQVQEAAPVAPIRIIPTFKTAPLKGKAKQAADQRAAVSKDAWNLF